MSTTDPVDIVRRARHSISARVAHDPAKLIEYYERFQESFRDRLLRKPVDVGAAGETAGRGDSR